MHKSVPADAVPTCRYMVSLFESAKPEVLNVTAPVFMHAGASEIEVSVGLVFAPTV